MLLKRIYDPADLARYGAELATLQARGLSREAAEAQTKPARVTAIELRHTGIDPAQNFSAGLVLDGMAAGWLRIDGDAITLDVQPEPLRYRIIRKPGYYCAHTGERIPLSELAVREAQSTGIGRLAAAEAQAWLAARGLAGKVSPKPAWPHGYEVVNGYECELDSVQHAKYRAKRGALAMSQRAGA